MGDEEDIFFCDDCEGLFLTEEKLKEHQKSEHQQPPPPSPDRKVLKGKNLVLLCSIFDESNSHQGFEELKEVRRSYVSIMSCNYMFT